MTKELTEIVFILDKSGSMHSIKSDAIGGFNAFVKDQLEQEGETKVTLVLFDDKIETLVDVYELTDATYKPSGLTALLDAIGLGIDNLTKRLSESEIQPKNVVFAIMTDGHENASREYSADMVRNKIKNLQSEKDWQFIFLGANIDAVGTATNLGIKADFAGDFFAKGNGASTAMLNMSEMTSVYRATGKMASYNSVMGNNDTDGGTK